MFEVTALEQRNYDFWDSRSPDILVSSRIQLQAIFPEDQVDKLPRYAGKRNTPKDKRKQGKCEVCNGFHQLPAVHLDYVGHAHLTRRLIEVDPYWTWRPMFDPAEGVPQGDTTKMWGWITILGVTRPCFGDVDPTKNDLEKEVIGDLIRNGAMRFGVALEHWEKGGDVHYVNEEGKKYGGWSKGNSSKGGGHTKPPGPVVQFMCACSHEDRSAAFHTIKAEYKARDGTFDEGEKISKCPKCAMWAASDSYAERAMEKGGQS